MSAAKLLWGQILIVLVTALTAVWAATEWTAWRLAFQPELGSPWFRRVCLANYQPQSSFLWWYHFDAYAPTIFMQGAYIAVSGGVLAVVAATACQAASQCVTFSRPKPFAETDRV